MTYLLFPGPCPIGFQTFMYQWELVWGEANDMVCCVGGVDTGVHCVCVSA